MTDNSELKSTTVDAREFVDDFDIDHIPRDGTYRVVASYAIGGTEVVEGGIEGKYHALYLRDKLDEELGFAGVSFIMQKEDE